MKCTRFEGRKASGTAEAGGQRDQRLRRRHWIRQGPAALQRKDEIRRQRINRQELERRGGVSFGRDSRLPGCGGRRRHSPGDGAEAGLGKEVDRRKDRRLDGRRNDSAAVNPDGCLWKQRGMGRLAGRAHVGPLLRGGLMSCAAGAGVGEAGERQFVLQPLMGFTVCLGTEHSVRDSAQERQFVPAV